MLNESFGFFGFLYIAGAISFVALYIFAKEPKTKRDTGIAILFTLFWPIPTIYYIIRLTIVFISWLFSCISAIFIPEQKQLISTGFIDAEQVENNKVKYTPTVYNDQCKHCGSSSQFGSVCNRCGAPL